VEHIILNLLRRVVGPEKRDISRIMEQEVLGRDNFPLMLHEPHRKGKNRAEAHRHTDRKMIS
jgi:hypothetical protein